MENEKIEHTTSSDRSNDKTVDSYSNKRHMYLKSITILRHEYILKTDGIETHRMSHPLFTCWQKSRDLQQVRAKRNSKDMAANVAKTHKEGRYFTQDTKPVYNDLTAWQLNQGGFSIP